MHHRPTLNAATMSTLPRAHAKGACRCLTAHVASADTHHETTHIPPHIPQDIDNNDTPVTPQLTGSSNSGRQTQDTKRISENFKASHDVAQTQFKLAAQHSKYRGRTWYHSTDPAVNVTWIGRPRVYCSDHATSMDELLDGCYCITGTYTTLR